MMRLFFAVFIACVSVSCTKKNTWEAKKVFSAREYDALLTQLAPYVIKRPDGMSYDERFDPKNKDYYENYLAVTDGKVVYYTAGDTAEFFSFEYRDRASLFEHYRTIGGSFRRDPTGHITFLNLLYHTPRCERAEMDAKAQVLFKEMIVTGNVNSFIGNRLYIQTPNADFFYDTKRNIWDYTPESSWRFMEEARQQTESAKRDSLN